MRGKTSPADVRHPFRAQAVVAMPGGGMVRCSLKGTWLVPSALRAPAQLAPATPSVVREVPAARAQDDSISAVRRSACSRSLLGRENREEQQCGQEGRRSSHGLLQLPPDVCLQPGRGFWCLRVLKEGARVVGVWRSVVVRFQVLPQLALRGPWQGLLRHGPPQQRTAKQQTAQVSTALHVMVGRCSLVE